MQRRKWKCLAAREILLVRNTAEKEVIWTYQKKSAKQSYHAAQSIYSTNSPTVYYSSNSLYNEFPNALLM